MSQLNIALFRCLDYFAAPVYGNDATTLSRVRALVGTNLFIGSVMLMGIIFVSLTDSVGELGTWVSYSLLLPALLINLVVPFIVRSRGWIFFCQQLTLLTTYTAVIAGISITGGPVLASNNQLMVLQAALAFFLLGIRGGAIWAMVVLFSQCFLYYLFISGVDFPNYQVPEAATASAIFNWILAFLSIISLIVLIELSREKLEEERNIERDRLEHLATHDPLTEIPNRALFEEVLNRAVTGHQATDKNAVLFYIDLDDFKPINDQWGHDTGDKVLKIIAARLKASTREKDIVARLGGDEFAVLMTSVEKEKDVGELAEIIHHRIAEEIHIRGQHFKLSSSIGICIFPDQADSASLLWQRADDAMYQAKKNSQRWHLYP